MNSSLVRSKLVIFVLPHVGPLCGILSHLSPLQSFITWIASKAPLLYQFGDENNFTPCVVRSHRTSGRTRLYPRSGCFLVSNYYHLIYSFQTAIIRYSVTISLAFLNWDIDNSSIQSTVEFHTPHSEILFLSPCYWGGSFRLVKSPRISKSRTAWRKLPLSIF